ncbi:MAG: response regulator [bacterium]|nr:response regulator [bacterium]
MNENIEILITEDDSGHAKLIEKNLRRAGIVNRITIFKDGREVLDFLFGKSTEVKVAKVAKAEKKAYLLLLDIRMPHVDGVDVLKKIKADEELRKVPVIMLTTLNSPEEVGRCHDLGCSSFISKPVEYEEFEKVINYLGLFLSIVQVPTIRRDE